VAVYLRRLAVGLLTWIGVVAVVALPTASAHKGPPFPIFMDKPLAGYSVSVWADPDIGLATFFVVVESPQGGKPSDAPGVSMWVEPTSGRLDRVTCETKLKPLDNQLEFEARPYFDQGDMWTVGFRLTPPGGEAREVTVEVESTPPGNGPWDFAFYIFPFVLIAGLWVFAMIRRKRYLRALAAQEEDEPESPLPESPPRQSPPREVPAYSRPVESRTNRRP